MRKFLVTATLATVIAGLSATEATSFGEAGTGRWAAKSARVVLAGPTSWEVECWSGNSGRPHCNS